MVKQDLMSRITKAFRPSRNRFDISSGRKFTSQAGMLLPIYYRELCPNNHISLNISNLTRTLPFKSANFARMNENFDVFFVPFRLLQTGIQEMLVGSDVNRTAGHIIPNECAHVKFETIQQYLAYVKDKKLSDDAGIPMTTSLPRLLHSLGVGYFSQIGNAVSDQKADSVFSHQSSNNSYINVFTNALSETPQPFDKFSVSILPFLAYQKIYQDYFRNKFWERENTDTYLWTAVNGKETVTLDDLKLGILQMRYSNFDKDRIFGMMPDEGNVLSTGINLVNITAKSNTMDAVGSDSVPNALSSVAHNALYGNVSYSSNVEHTRNYQQLLDYFKNLSATPANVDEFKELAHSTLDSLNALNLRRMEAWQRFAEICSLNKDDYKHQMSAIFGTDIPDLNSNYCTYLGGKTQPIQVSDIEQTSSGDGTSTNTVGALAGRGTSFGNGANIDFTANEHGFLMVIYHVQPQVDWVANNIDPQLRHFDRYDFQNPVFDSLGFEPVRLCDVFSPLLYFLGNNTSKYLNPMLTLGWLPRYWQYKTDVDICQQGFADTTANGLNTYILPFDFKHYLKRINHDPSLPNLIDYRFFKVYPQFVQNLFTVVPDGTVETDPFICSAQVNAIVDLPLSVDGLPY